MTGPWLMVKWIGISIDAAYLVLLVAVLVRFRRHQSRLRPWLILPVVFGLFISGGTSIFGNVAVARICFIAARLIYLAGIAILLRGLSQKNHEFLLKMGRLKTDS